MSTRSGLTDSSFISSRSPSAGNNAAFEIQLEEKTASLTWLKDNKPLDDRLADRITTTESDGNYYQLNIKHCAESDTGLYTARACNSNSDVVTCSAQLIVHESKCSICGVVWTDASNGMVVTFFV